MKIDYVNINGYLVPALYSSEKSHQPLGKYGCMRAEYLDEHNPLLRDRLMLEGKLYDHLAEIDREAHRQVDETISRLAQQHGIDEKFKQEKPYQWAAEMNSFRLQAKEIVLRELVYAKP